MVGMVVTISPSLSLYKMVVFPAASRPTVKYKRKCLISYMYQLHSDKQHSKKAGYSSVTPELINTQIKDTLP